MMADFMHENMGDDGAKRLVVFRPKIEDRAAVEPHHIGELPGHESCAGLRTATAAKQAQKIEFALAVHRIERFIVSKILDADHDAIAKLAKTHGKGGESRLRHQLKIGERRRRYVMKLRFASFQEVDFSVAGRQRRLSRT